MHSRCHCLYTARTVTEVRAGREENVPPRLRQVASVCGRKRAKASAAAERRTSRTCASCRGRWSTPHPRTRSRRPGPRRPGPAGRTVRGHGRREGRAHSGGGGGAGRGCRLSDGSAHAQRNADRPWLCPRPYESAVQSRCGGSGEATGGCPLCHGAGRCSVHNGCSDTCTHARSALRPPLASRARLRLPQPVAASADERRAVRADLEVVRPRDEPAVPTQERRVEGREAEHVHLVEEPRVDRLSGYPGGRDEHADTEGAFVFPPEAAGSFGVGGVCEERGVRGARMGGSRGLAWRLMTSKRAAELQSAKETK